MPKKLHLLIVDDDTGMVETLVDILNASGYNAVAAFSGSEALERAKESHFDSLLTDIKMPGMNGIELAKAFHAEHPDVPVLFMTAFASESVVQEGIDEGVLGVLDKPLDISLLLDFFSKVIDERPIVIVDDDTNFCKTVGDILEEKDYSVLSLGHKDEIQELINHENQLIILDMKLNGINGLDVLKTIKNKSPNQAVILVTGYHTEMAEFVETALKLSAYTCLYKPLEIKKLFGVIKEIHNLALSRLITDGSHS